MSETTRMRSLKTKDNKDLTPEAIIDILDSFMNDPLIYNPEINVANFKLYRPWISVKIPLSTGLPLAKETPFSLCFSMYSTHLT